MTESSTASRRSAWSITGFGDARKRGELVDHGFDVAGLALDRRRQLFTSVSRVLGDDLAVFAPGCARPRGRMGVSGFLIS